MVRVSNPTSMPGHTGSLSEATPSSEATASQPRRVVSATPTPRRNQPHSMLGIGELVSRACETSCSTTGDATRASNSLFGLARGYNSGSASAASFAPTRANTLGTTSDAFYGSVGVRGNVHAEDIDSSISGAMSLNRNGLSTNAKLTTASGERFGTSSFLKSGYFSLGVNAAIDLEEKFAWADKGGAALYLGGYVGGWNNCIGVGGNIGVAVPGGSIKIGANLSLSADRSVRYLGEYKGDEEQLQGRHGVEIKLSNSKTAGGSVGVSNGLLGVGGRLSSRKSKSVIYRTFLQEDSARQIVGDAKTDSDLVQEKAEALALQSKALPIPNLRDPSTMQVGDEVVLQTSGMIKGGVVLGGLGPAVSVNGHMEGTFQVSARKIDDTHVELVVSPRKVSGIGLGASVPLIHAEASYSLALAMRQAFVFDLSKPQAHQSYLRALNGTLPCNMQSPNAVAENDDGRLLAAMNCEELPEGVHRTFLEKAEVPMTCVGISTGLRFLPAEAGIAGLSYYHISARKKQVITDGVTALTLQTKGLEDKWELLWSGEESQAVSATLYRKSTYEGPGKYTRDFDKLSIKARLSDSQLVGNDCNDKIIGPVNNAFGLTIDEFSRSGHKQSREVKLEQVLNASDFKVLSKFTPARLRVIANQSGADIGELTNLVASLETEFNPWDQARFVQDFVSSQKLKGFGAIYQMLNEPVRLNVTTTSDSYTKPLNDVKELAFDYNEPVQPWQEKRVLNRRFSDVYEAIDAVKLGLRDLEDDTIMKEFEPEQYASTKDRLTHARRELSEMVEVRHLTPMQRHRLYAKLASKSLFHQVDILAGRYENNIHPNESKGEIKQRFVEVEPVLRKVEKELRELKDDDSLKTIDHTNQRDQQESLLEARAKLRNLLSFSHLDSLERGRVYRKFEQTTGCMPSRRSAVSRKIMGILIGEGTEFPEFAPL